MRFSKKIFKYNTDGQIMVWISKKFSPPEKGSGGGGQSLNLTAENFSSYYACSLSYSETLIILKTDILFDIRP